jgi:hypothetical protein
MPWERLPPARLQRTAIAPGGGRSAEPELTVGERAARREGLAQRASSSRSAATVVPSATHGRGWRRPLARTAAREDAPPTQRASTPRGWRRRGPARAPNRARGSWPSSLPRAETTGTCGSRDHQQPRDDERQQPELSELDARAPPILATTGKASSASPRPQDESARPSARSHPRSGATILVAYCLTISEYQAGLHGGVRPKSATTLISHHPGFAPVPNCGRYDTQHT